MWLLLSMSLAWLILKVGVVGCFALLVSAVVDGIDVLVDVVVFC